MSLVEHHIRLAYLELGDGVSRALHTQVGDAARLNEHKRRCLQFLQDIQQVRVLLSHPHLVPVFLASTSGFFVKLKSSKFFMYQAEINLMKSKPFL